MGEKNPYLSVVIPCYNEEKNLERGVLQTVENYLKGKEFSSEVIISDDGSKDGSISFVEKFARKTPRFRLLKNKHGGKPFAVRSGIERAQGEIILVPDMDLSTPIEEFDKLQPYFGQGFDVVIGSRGQTRKGFSLLRKTASRVFILFRKLMLLKQISDTQCGFKAFRNKIAKDLFPSLLVFKKMHQTVGWKVGAFDVELLFIASKRGYRIVEVPVDWRDRDLAAGSKGIKGKFLKESKEMFFEILRVKLSDWQGRYD